MSPNNQPIGSESVLETLRRLEQRVATLEQKLGCEQSASPAVPPPLPDLPAQRAPTVADVLQSLPPAKPATPIPVAPATEAKQIAWEQFLGKKGLLIVGVLVLLLGGAFFFKYAIEQGWINPLSRTIMGAIWGLVMVVLGEWAFRRNMRYFAAGLFGAGVVWWYKTVYAASPNGVYADSQLLNTPWAFVLMCCTTAAAVGLSLRSNFRVSGLIALIGALATPVLLSTNQDQQVPLMCYLLVVNAGFLLLGAARRWDELAPIAMAGTVGLFAAWFVRHYHAPEQWAATSAWAWAQFAMFFIYAAASLAGRRVHEHIASALMLAGAVSLGVLWYVMELTDVWFFGQLLTLIVAVLALCLLRPRRGLRLALFVVVVVLAALQYARNIQTGSEILWAGWVWGMYGIFLADIIVRMHGRFVAAASQLDPPLAGAATGVMFAATYMLLRDVCPEWMGAYAAGLGALAIVGAWIIRRRTVHRATAYSFLGQGLVLITLAVPIQWDLASVTLAWTIQGTVLMFLARRLRSNLLLAASPLVLILAAGHYMVCTMPNDSQMRLELASPMAVPIRYGLLLAMAVSAGMATSAGILTGGEVFGDRRRNVAIACQLGTIATVVYLVQTVRELPMLTATWWWIVPAAALWGLALLCRWRIPWMFALSVLALAAGKWVVFDTLVGRSADVLRTITDASTVPSAEGVALWRIVGLNWQFAAGLAMAAILMLTLRLAPRRLEGVPKRLAIACWIVGALLVVWGGSFEIDRYILIQAARDALSDTRLAMQMGLSIWWALSACAILAIGFARTMPAARFLAMAIFAVTVGKVFLLDMAGVQAIYRILSFLILGVLMLVGSLLYHRTFRDRPGRTEGD